MFFDSYQIPRGILEYLSDRDIIQLSLVNKKIDCELADDRNKRRTAMIDFLLKSHYRFDWGVFSIHYYYKTHKISHRACFRMIAYFLPELFAFLEQNQSRILDFSAFSSISSDFFFSVEEQRMIASMLLHHIKHNQTLRYVSLSMFRDGLTWEQVEAAAEDHPCLWVDKSSPTSFFHHSVIRRS